MTAFDEARYKERVNAFPFVRLMGMSLLSAGGGKSVMRCRIRQLLRNSAGTLHGGVMGALVDMSIFTALRSVMPADARATTVEYKVNFLKPVGSGVVTAHGAILRLGRTIAVGATEIRNADAEVVAFGSATFYVLAGKSGAGVPGVGGKVAPGGARPGRRKAGPRL